MRKTLAAAALGAAIVFGGPQLAHAETATPAPVATATETATATATPTVQETVTTTEHTNTTVTEHDKTGLWGLLGLAGLAGLLRKPKKEHHVETRHTATTVRPAEHTEARRVDDVRTEPGVRPANGTVRSEGIDLNKDGRRDI